MESVTHPVPLQKAQQPLSAFQTDLKNALKAFLPTNERPYTKVIVAMITWRNVPEYDEEVEALKDVFESIYHYSAVRLSIPCGSNVANSQASATLLHDLSKIPLQYDKDDLIIVYYAGHAVHEYDKSRARIDRACIIQ